MTPPCALLQMSLGLMLFNLRIMMPEPAPFALYSLARTPGRVRAHNLLPFHLRYVTPLNSVHLFVISAADGNRCMCSPGRTLGRAWAVGSAAAWSRAEGAGGAARASALAAVTPASCPVSCWSGFSGHDCTTRSSQAGTETGRKRDLSGTKAFLIKTSS